MKTKREIRQRRQERIKELTDKREKQYHRSEPPREAFERNQAEAYRPPYDKRLEDPEYVWKMKRSSFGWDNDPYDFEHQGGDDRWREWTTRPTKKQFKGKILFSILVFGLVWGMFQLHSPWALKGQEWVRKAMTEDYQFAKAAAWYRQVFGDTPVILPAFGKDKNKDKQAVSGQADEPWVRPAQGRVITSFAATGQGIFLHADPASPVKALLTGRVVQVTRTAENGILVVIQHAGGYESVYGLLGSSPLGKNDWVKGGSLIGNTGDQQDPGKANLYFAVRKNSQYLNPTDVMSFD
ncbi:peptidoglycan DD-metalloendopeptidase family protein [Ferviditalea candida]|uniref:M23 family metallopeptidase n=1 Tax=Ferviditalea candida TaxID=3108399 RepID=A0ABU5ZDP6_9BACL|nr:M23 family metallopeptidase [Paenibacillaceae bacterium T2]